MYILIIYHNEKRYATYHIAEKSGFKITWIHSVEDEAWEESFILIDDKILLEATRFRTFGAGVPHTAPRTKLEEGWVSMEGFSRQVDPLYIRVNEISEHTLVLPQQKLILPVGRVHIMARRRG